jgi:sodium-dependent dicarboxylate transporter 2/3/5
MKKLLFTILAFALFALIVFIHIPGLTTAQNYTLAIFVLAAALWITEPIPLYVTSLLILFLAGVILPRCMEGVNFESFTSSFFSPVLLLFMGGFAIATMITAYRLDDRIAKIIVQKTSGKPLMFLISIASVTAFLSMWMSNTAATALMLAVPLPILRKLDADDKFKKAVILSVPFGASIGGIGTPVGSPPNALALSQLKNIGMDISFGKWMIAGLPVMIITMAFMIFLLYKMFPGKVKVLPEIDIKVDKLTRKQIIAIAVVLVTVALWLTSPIHKLSSYQVALLPVIFLFGSGMLKRDHFQQLGWNVLVLIAGGTVLGFAISKTGLDVWLINKLGLEAVSATLALVIAAFFTGLLSNFMSNTSTAAIVLPIILGLSAGNTSLSAIAIAIAASSAMMLPVSTPPNAIAYGSDMIKIKDMLKAGTVVFLFMSFTIILHILFVWKYLF